MHQIERLKRMKKVKTNANHENILTVTRVSFKSRRDGVHRLTCKGPSDDRYMVYSEGEECYVKLRCSADENVYTFAFIAKAGYELDNNDALKISFNLTGFQEATVLSLDKIWWTFPHFAKSQNEIPQNTIAIFYKTTEGKHACLVTVPGNGFSSRIKGKSISIDCGKAHRNIQGIAMIIAVADDPYTAVHNCFEHMFSSKRIHVPLRDARKEVGTLRGFGWCTWNAFYQDVNEEGIIAKMEEFKEKNIIPSFVLIDDGWSPTINGKLTSFDADPVKFPNGLAATVAKIKSYGVKYVGVWHTLNLYWDGVCEDSPLFEEIKDHLIKTSTGMWMPKPNMHETFAIFSAWYTRLKEQGIDFVKVDNQSSLPYYLIDGCKSDHIGQINKGLDKAAAQIFGADIINCMGHDPENTFNRLLSVINRNSDDYFPNLHEEGFAFHAMCNAYNSIYYGELYIPDYDMFWSEDSVAKSAALLRAVSGGPIYTSDKVGHTDPKYIKPLILPDGNVVRCDNAGRPTLDCFYVDCPTANYPLKIWNTLNNEFVLAVFNLTNSEMTASFSPKEIPTIDDGLYEIKNCMTGETFRIERHDNATCTLAPFDSVAYLIKKIY